MDYHLLHYLTISGYKREDRLKVGSETADVYFWINFQKFFTVSGDIINMVIEILSTM